MKNKAVILLVLVALLALAIPTFAETAGSSGDEQTAKINSLQRQILELRMQMVDEMEKAGYINQERGQLMKNHMQQRIKYLEQNPDAIGPMKNGAGFCDGTNRGYGMGRACIQ